MGYAMTENPYHSCEFERCQDKSKWMVYPSGQPSGIMKGSVLLCERHKRTFVRRYNKAQSSFYDSAQNGLETGIVHQF